MHNIQERNKENSQSPQLLAAIDLGSNSFHMIVAKIDNGELRPIERVAEKVQLAQGLKDGHLSESSIERGLECLKRFKQVLASLKPSHTRVVGTNTLRAAKNAATFNRKAEKILGQAIEIVAGREEARLVYLGVSHTLADDDTPRLVIDIGGGSTEFIIGQRFEANECESLHMGCVSYSNRFFSDGTITAKNFAAAYKAACVEVSHIRSQYHGNWSECVGSSGTFKALALISAAEGFTEHGISRHSLVAIKDTLIAAGTFDAIRLKGLKENRRNVIAGGCAVALAIFDTLQIDTMRHSVGALREGVIYDTLGRINHEDVRERTVFALESRYNINSPNLETIVQRCKHLFQSVASSWQLTSNDLQFLLWAARLHEIGLTIAHTQYQKHGQYLLENSDLPGFSKNEQRLLAALVRAHRRKIPLAELNDELNQPKTLQLVALLRISLAFKYADVMEPTPAVKAKAKNNALVLTVPADWLQAHPLSQTEILNEIDYLQLAGFELILKGN